MFKPILVTLILNSTAAFAHDYYVSPSGNDANSGTSLAEAFATLKRASEIPLHPGDRILLEGGKEHHGNLRLNVKGGGVPSNPIEVTSANAKRARIVPTVGDGIYVENASGITIHDLDVVGNRAHGNGIRIHSTDPARSPKKIRISDVSVSGFATDLLRKHLRHGGNGVLISAAPGAQATQDVVLERIDASQNDYAGIGFFSESRKRHEKVLVTDCRAHNNDGIRGFKKDHTGNGITLGQVEHATVERSWAYQNGKNNEAEGGPVGIWTWDSRWVKIRNNLSFENKTSSKADGGGFDFDGGVSDSVMEHNVSFNNDGAGYLLSTYPGSGPVERVAVRGNFSINDGRKNGYGALAVWGDVSESIFEGNTVTVSISYPSSVPAWGAKVVLWTGHGVTFKANLFTLGGNARLFSFSSIEGLRFVDNHVEIKPGHEAGAPVSIENAQELGFLAWKELLRESAREDDAVGISEVP